MFVTVFETTLSVTNSSDAPDDKCRDDTDVILRDDTNDMRSDDTNDIRQH